MNPPFAVHVVSVAGVSRRQAEQRLYRLRADGRGNGALSAPHVPHTPVCKGPFIVCRVRNKNRFAYVDG